MAGLTLDLLVLAFQGIAGLAVIELGGGPLGAFVTGQAGVGTERSFVQAIFVTLHAVGGGVAILVVFVALSTVEDLVAIDELEGLVGAMADAHALGDIAGVLGLLGLTGLGVALQTLILRELFLVDVFVRVTAHAGGLGDLVATGSGDRDELVEVLEVGGPFAAMAAATVNGEVLAKEREPGLAGVRKGQLGSPGGVEMTGCALADFAKASVVNVFVAGIAGAVGLVARGGCVAGLARFFVRTIEGKAGAVSVIKVDGTPVGTGAVAQAAALLAKQGVAVDILVARRAVGVPVAQAIHRPRVATDAVDADVTTIDGKARVAVVIEVEGIEGSPRLGIMAALAAGHGVVQLAVG